MLLNFSNVFSTIITLVVIVWLGVATFLLVKIYKTFSHLTKGVSDKNLKVVIEEMISEAKKNEELNSDLKKAIADLQSEDKGHFQKIGLLRFNPFSETGGNQSFVLALLDGHGNGFVITSLHSRDSTRVFAKPVKEGKEAGFEFSKEEIQAILSAQKKEKVVKK